MISNATAAARTPGLKRYFLLAAALMGTLLAAFLIAEAADVPLLTDPTPWLGSASPWVAAMGVGLLIIDVFLPVPSSLVMTLHGALFGVVGGTLLSAIGGIGATLFGFGLGRIGEPMLQRFLQPDERQRAARMLERWGPLAILLSRPVPLLAETVAILAGASPLRWRTAVLSAFGGVVPIAFAYAWIGSEAARSSRFVLFFGIIMLLTGAAAFLMRRR